MVEHTGITMGIEACLHVDTTDDAFTNAIALMNAVGWSQTAGLMDLTVMCSAVQYIQRAQGLQSATITGGGFFDRYNDTTGQKLVFDNMISDAGLWFKLYLDGTSSGHHWLKSQAVVTNITIKTTPAGSIDWSFSADSTSALTSGTVA